MIGKEKRMKRTLRLTERDIKILALCHKQKYVTLDQIARAFFPGNKNKYKVPLRCINRLMKRELIRSLKQGIGMASLYLVGMKGLEILREKRLANHLPYVKTVDWKSYQHDLVVTDVRLIFEQLGFEWTPRRVLHILHPRKKVSDGKARYDNHLFSIEVEKEHQNHSSYRWIFAKRCRDRLEKVILYFVKDEKRRLSRLKEAMDFNRIYFMSIDEFLERGGEAEFINSLDDELILEDLIHPEETRELARSLDLFRNSDREYLGWLRKGV